MAEVRHVYASIAEFNDYLRDAGSVTFVSESALISGRKRATLEAVSRVIDTWCQRSYRARSGFGPRTGTNRYGPVSGSCLHLKDDLLSITSVTAYDSPGGTGTTLTDETDFYKHTGDDYDQSPYRALTIHEASSASWGAATRGNHVVGSWGYQDVRVTSASTTAEVLDTSETGVDVTAGTDFSPGQTILVESEQMYVTAIATNTLTVVRGVNGTTAATHITASAISVYTYPVVVHDVCLRLAMRRWKGRDAGADGSDGGGDVPGTTIREGEDTILRRGLSQLAYRSAN